MKTLMPDDNFNLLMRYNQYHNMLLTFLFTNSKSLTASQSQSGDKFTQLRICYFRLIIAYFVLVLNA